MIKHYGRYLLVTAALLFGCYGMQSYAYRYKIINATPFSATAKVKTGDPGKDGLREVPVAPHSVVVTGDGSGHLLYEVSAQVVQTYTGSELTGDILDPKKREQHLGANTVSVRPYHAPAGVARDQDFIIAGPLFNKKRPAGYAGAEAGMREPYYVVTRSIQ